MTRTAASLLMASLVACDGPAPDSDVPSGRSSGATPVVVTGRVVASGSDSAPEPRLYLDTGHAIRIRGELQEEIQRLAGARITVVGDPGPVEGVLALSYAILEVNGERPHVGVVARRAGAYALLGEAGALGLAGWDASSLDTLLGSKIWVTGSLRGDTLRLEAYGLIRPR